MIDDLVAELKQDQVNDDSKKEYCEEQFDLSDAKKKLEDGNKALDKEVAEATENLYGKF